MSTVREDIPSLVPIPFHTYGRLSVICALMIVTVLLSGGVVALLESGSVMGLRPLEPSDRGGAGVEGELAMVNACRRDLSQAENALAQREVSVASLRAPIQTLEALQSELPQEVWIKSLRVSRGRVELVLNTISEGVSVGLADRLTKSRRILDVHVQSIERSQTNGGSLFVIRLTASVRG